MTIYFIIVEEVKLMSAWSQRSFSMKYIVFWQADSFHLFNNCLLNVYYVSDVLQGREDIIINIVLDLIKLTVSWGKHTLQRQLQNNYL